MAVVLLIAPANAGEPVIGPASAVTLQRLGITRVSLLRDGATTGLVLEGWAFDPTRADDATRAIFPGGHNAVRTLHEIEHVAVAGRADRRTP